MKRKVLVLADIQWIHSQFEKHAPGEKMNYHTLRECGRALGFCEQIAYSVIVCNTSSPFTSSLVKMGFEIYDKTSGSMANRNRLIRDGAIRDRLAVQLEEQMAEVGHLILCGACEGHMKLMLEKFSAAGIKITLVGFEEPSLRIPFDFIEIDASWYFQKMA